MNVLMKLQCRPMSAMASKSLATRLLAQQFIWTNITENTQSSALLCDGNPSVTGGFPSQRTSHAQSASISWRHHEITVASRCLISLYNEFVEHFYCIELLKFVQFPNIYAISIQKTKFHKSQNARVPYPTTLHSEQKCGHLCSEWSIVGYGRGAFWDFWIRLI